jgi:hypothetical protein
MLSETQIKSAIRLPADAIRRLREGSYQLPDGRSVSFTDAQTLTDARDLYAVLKEQHMTGSSNLENDIVRQILTDLTAGNISAAQHGALNALLVKYRGAISKLRASPDHQGQDYGKVAPLGTGRITP